MTLAQWAFHYQECMRAEKKEAEREKDILSMLEVYAMYSHPKIDLQKISQAIQQRKLKENAGDLEKELKADYDMAMQILPETLDIIVDEPKVKPVLPLSQFKKRKRSSIRRKKKDL